MRISAVVVYQQVRQLIWHLLACLVLVMVLPLDEAILNFLEGRGFYSERFFVLSMMFSPLLMGLIGCANVQADLNERSYIFWRSKPASTKLFITIKYLVGLIAGSVIVVCPLVFSIVSSRLNFNRSRIFLSDSDGIEMLLYVLIGVLTYSICFCGNVLIRKSARAWLIGMAVSCLLLILPFVLPLGYKDYRIDVLESMSFFYISLIIIVSAVAFVFSIFAAERDWHLKTNLKRLLWAGFGAAFAVMMIFSSQVANIRVLQEKEIEDAWPQSFSSVDGKILFQGKGYIDVDRDNISFEESFADHFRIINDRFPFKSEAEKTYRRIIYPRHSGLYQVIGGELYLFHMHASGWAIGGYEKLHLISLRLVDNRWEAACELDISDCLRGEGGESAKMVRMVMKYINNRIIAYINTGSRDGSCVVVDVSSPSELKLIEKRPVLFDWGLFFDEQDKFAIPLVSIDGVDIKEKIQLSVDLYTEILINEYGEYRTSVVDIDGDRISFFHVSGKGIKRYDVIDWDDENVYCELSVERSFTILEQLIDRWCNRVFTKNGKLYVYNDESLMVFDIRSGERIRKLGHFVRAHFRIKDIMVLENGDILMSSGCDYGRGSCTTAELFCGTDL